MLEPNTGGDFINKYPAVRAVWKNPATTSLTLRSNSIPVAPLSAAARWSPLTLTRWKWRDHDNATLELNTGGTFDNAISGSGRGETGDETCLTPPAPIYTGGTLISSGTLVANDVNALGTGDVTDNAVLELNTGGDLTTPSAAAAVVKSATRSLTLSGATYTGGTSSAVAASLVATSVEALEVATYRQRRAGTEHRRHVRQCHRRQRRW